MICFEPGPDRWKLGFKEAVLENFKFLRKYGFRLVRADVTFVRYETSWYSFKRKFYVNVYHARGGYVMGVEIGPKNNDREMVNLPWILKWAGAPEFDAYFGPKATKAAFLAETKDAVQAIAPKMADLVQRYAGPLLRRDAEALGSVAAMRKRAGDAWIEKVNRSAPRRHEAALAWEAQDFGRVIDIFETLEDDLTEGERAKLAEAKRRLEARATAAAKPNHGAE